MKKFGRRFDVMVSSPFADLDSQSELSVRLSPVVFVGLLTLGLWALIFAAAALVWR